MSPKGANRSSSGTISKAENRRSRPEAGGAEGAETGRVKLERERSEWSLTRSVRADRRGRSSAEAVLDRQWARR